MDSRNCANRLTITQAGKSTARTNACGTRVSGDPGAASFPGCPAAAMRRLTSISLGKTLPNADRLRSTRGAPPVTIQALGRSRSPVRAPPTAGARPPSSAGVGRDSRDCFPTVASLSRGIRAPAQRPASPRSPSVRARRRMVCTMSTAGDTHHSRRHRRHRRHPRRCVVARRAATSNASHEAPRPFDGDHYVLESYPSVVLMTARTGVRVEFAWSSSWRPRRRSQCDSRGHSHCLVRPLAMRVATRAATWSHAFAERRSSQLSLTDGWSTSAREPPPPKTRRGPSSPARTPPLLRC